MSAPLFIEQAPRQGAEIEVTGELIVGREGTDIVLPDPEVSRRHAAVRLQGEGVVVEDLGSTNGTFVNDERLSGSRDLRDGDTVRFGNTVWQLRAPAGATTIGQIAGTQVTAARSIPAAAPPQPAPAPAPQAAPAAPAAPAADMPRGDVPAPPEVVPSAVRRVVAAPPGGAAPAFAPPAARRRGSAATRVEATVVCMVFALAVAIAIAIYFASQG